MESATHRDLEARLSLRAQLKEIQKHVERHKWASKASTISARFPALLRSLTGTSKNASEQLLNQDFERLFAEERKALRAPEVRVYLP